MKGCFPNTFERAGLLAIIVVQLNQAKLSLSPEQASGIVYIESRDLKGCSL